MKLSTGNFKRNLESEQVEPIETTDAVSDEVVATDQPEVVEDAPEAVIEEEVVETAVEDNIKPENEPSGSSLKTDNEPEQVVQKPIEVNDDLVNKYLSEKLGREFSLEDLAKEPVTNPLDSDPYMKEIYEWRVKTGRPVEDYIKFQKDFSTVPDLDVAREFLQLEYPNSTPDEINLELKRFVASEDDLDDEVAQKNWELKKYATKGRSELNKLKSTMGEPNANSLPVELQEKISFADQMKAQMSSNQKMQEDYDSAIRKTAQTVDKMTLDLGGEKSIDFLVSSDIKKSVPDTISQMPHWRNEDGSWNHRAVVEDGIKIQNFDAMIKLAYEQGQNAGKDDIIRETKNINLDDKGSSAQPNQKSKRPVYEDEVSKRKLKIGFGKK